MNSRTVAALNRINRRFYARQARSFSATRSYPWPGWGRVLEPFVAGATRGRGSRALRSILDVGCGNGRFGVHLGSVSKERFRYMGIDESAPLLRLARDKMEPISSLEAEFGCVDLTQPLVQQDLAGERFDLIVLFGVLHHIPGLEHRRRLLSALTGRLAPGGYLAASFWQFGARQRFRERMVDWTVFADATGVRVDEGQLERGDFLLTWGERAEQGPSAEDSDVVARYCHYADHEESSALVNSLGLAVVDQFDSDGRSGDLNRYYVLAAGGSEP